MVATAHAAKQTLSAPVPSRPYLASLGSTALRFREAVATQPLLRKPIASGPPVAASAPEVAEVALANNHAAASTPPIPTEAMSAATPAPAPAEENALPKVQPILPDDTRRKVQSQDFLPLFRFPGGASPAGDVTVIAPAVPTPPAPGTLPPSSATYRQQ